MRTNILTYRQRTVVLGILTSITEQGYPPTLRELAESMEVSQTNGVRNHLMVLERKGWIKVHPTYARGIKVLHPEMRAALVTGLLEGLLHEMPEIRGLVEILEKRFTERFVRQAMAAPAVDTVTDNFVLADPLPAHLSSGERHDGACHSGSASGGSAGRLSPTKPIVGEE
jgi:hypothetical protein|tara:strand:+ start:2473 stop:2982 length:510 start_codon:yes stop_codon:yes gene_type:complete